MRVKASHLKHVHALWPAYAALYNASYVSIQMTRLNVSVQDMNTG
jgi:hypothetical protein